MNVENGMIGLSISNRQLEHVIRHVRSAYGKFPLAISSAANRTMYGMGTDVARETVKRYFVKAGDVKKTIEYRKAREGDLIGRMISRGRRRSLGQYEFSPKRPKFQTNNEGRKVHVPLMGAVKREGGLKPFSDPGKPPLFLVKRTNGKYAPAYRSGRKKWAIRGLVSPSIPQIIKNEETVRAMEQSAEERFSKRVEHEIYYILDTLTR